MPFVSEPLPVFHKPDIRLDEPNSVRTLPELVEWHAAHNPDHVFCVQLDRQGRNAGFDLTEVSYMQLKHAILRCSHWFETEVLSRRADGVNGNGLHSLSPVALLVDSDIGLLINEFSLLALGVPVLLLSARLSPESIHHLLVSTSASTIIASPRLNGKALAALEKFGLAHAQPSFFLPLHWTELLKSDTRRENERRSIYRSGYNNSDRDVGVLILHSSGSTGLPKPISVPDKYLLSFTTCHDFASPEEAQATTLSLLPLYHGFGLLAPGLSLGVGMTFCLPPPSIIPTGESVLELLHTVGAASLMTVPSTLEDLSSLPNNEGIAALAPLQFVAYGGGPLKLVVGKRLASGGVKLLNHYGATETGPIAPIFVPRDNYNWQYFRLRKDMKISLEPFLDHEDEVQRYTLIARPYGPQSEHRIQDKLIADPNNSTTDFRVEGRTDDLIVLASGEKVMPSILETALNESDLVSAAVVFGEGRLELGIIIQPSFPVKPEQVEDFKGSIWPLISDAGAHMDAHAQISSKDSVIVLANGVKLPRSDKGSVPRKEVYLNFEHEIAKFYQDLDEIGATSSALTLEPATLTQGLKEIVQSLPNWKVAEPEWTANDDLFELGMDSLQATHLRHLLVSSTRKSTALLASDRIGPDFVYQHASLAEIARALICSDEASSTSQSSHTLIEELVNLYSLKGQEVVLLTGATGSLGAHLLANLTNLPTVSRVICLNRPSSFQDPFQRQMQAITAKAIKLSEKQESKVEVIECNLASPCLGLSTAKYIALRDQVTRVIHIAWPMDFKRKLPSFKSQFATVNNILHFMRDVRRSHPQIRPRMVFISSISVVGRYPQVQGERLVPEVPSSNSAWALPLGYAEAKLVCETIIQQAAEDFHADFEACSIRMGQISGSATSGYWNTDEHLAALVKSSQHLGALPALENTCSWIPLDSAAQCVSEILLHPSPIPAGSCYHVENPAQQPWGPILSTLAHRLQPDDDRQQQQPLASLPFDDWLQLVSASPAQGDRNPARSLPDFFQHDFRRMTGGNVVLDMRKAMERSPTLRALRPVSMETVAAYVDRWRACGFLV